VLRRDDDPAFALLTLTWEGDRSEKVDSVVVDGVVDACSVAYHREWLETEGRWELIGESSCTKACTTNVGIQDVGQQNAAGNNHRCVEMTLALGSVYDVLLSRVGVTNPLRALRVWAPWVSKERCVVSEGAATVCGGPDITWHGGRLSMGAPARVGTVGQSLVRCEDTSVPRAHDSGSTRQFPKIDTASEHVAFTSKTVRPSSDMADLVYLSLDRGMRITRIVTANTISPEAMLKLSRATSRDAVLDICVTQYRDKCVLTEHTTLPTSGSEVHTGWSFENRQGSYIRTKSGVPGSSLRVAELHHTPTCHISVGSWLLGSVPLNTDHSVASLFSRSVSRMCEEPQAVVLIRPGLAWPRLLNGNQMEWSITFLEMQETDKLGVPTK